MAKDVLLRTKDAADLLTLGTNAKNGVTNVDAAGNVFDGNTTGLDTSIAGQSVAGTAVTGIETAAVIAPEALPKIASGLGKTNVGLTGWGAYNDLATMRRDYRNPESKIQASSALSFGSNIAGGLAGGAAVAAGLGISVVGAPVIVILGGTSIALWGASMVVGDISANDAIVHGLGDIGTAASRRILRILDPENNAAPKDFNKQHELPEISGSQQNQLMAISKTPSFNYTSHEKDSTAGYTLVQVIDNAVSTAKQTTFNGVPAYLLAQTTQPTCMGDEAGVGGGVKSGTVGKEVKPTSASSTVFVEGKALVREGDTCTMNNGNTTGKYILV